MNKSKNKGKGGPGKKTVPPAKSKVPENQSKQVLNTTKVSQSNVVKSAPQETQPAMGAAKTVHKLAIPVGIPTQDPATDAIPTSPTSPAFKFPSLSPNPILSLLGADAPVTAVQFINPPILRRDMMTPMHAELFISSYGNFDVGDLGNTKLSELKARTSNVIKAPPPGFLQPTNYLAAGTQNGEIVIWDLKVCMGEFLFMYCCSSAFFFPSTDDIRVM